MSHQERFWILFSKKLSGESTLAELRELENLIREHPEWQYAIQNLQDLWQHQQDKDNQTEEDAYLLHLQRMQDRQIPFGEEHIDLRPVAGNRRKWYWAAAAAVLLLVSTGFILFRKNTAKASETLAAVSELNEVSTRPGSKTKIQLPDGTTVLLNSGSRLTYTKDYGKQLREVNLSGEGYFDVKKNKDLPFVIHTRDINIRVLGTVFNVKAYPEDKKSETSLIRGSIEVTMRNRPKDKIILSPNEKLVVETDKAELQENSRKTGVALKQVDEPSPMISVNKLQYSRADSTIAETQWIENRLVFRDESFTELAVRMERWYDVHIEITDAGLADMRLSGIFDKETIEQALDALRESTPFRYTKKDNSIIIHR